MFEFFGSYESKIDAKGRIIVPAQFRRQLNSGQSLKLYKTSLFDLPLVAVIPSYEVLCRYIEEETKRKYATNVELGHFEQMRIASIGVKRDVKLDTAGRLLLNKVIDFIPRERMIISGCNEVFEIWKENDFQEYSDIVESLRK